MQTILFPWDNQHHPLLLPFLLVIPLYPSGLSFHLLREGLLSADTLIILSPCVLDVSVTGLSVPCNYFPQHVNSTRAAIHILTDEAIQHLTQNLEHILYLIIYTEE